jgi:hypothetical protein
MNDFTGEPSEGATSSLMAQKSQLERVSPFSIRDYSKTYPDDEVDFRSF